MTVVAEGVESEEQVHALLSCGVEEGQGYLVGPPLPLTRFSDLLVAHTVRNSSGAASEYGLTA
ncbi:hypothetical protein [Bradyrhizobium sp. USDA 4472]